MGTQKDRYDWAEHERLVNTAMKATHMIYYDFWYEDIRQIISLTVYDKRDSEPGMRVSAARCRGIDEMRKLLGRSIRNDGKPDFKNIALQNQSSLSYPINEDGDELQDIYGADDPNMALAEIDRLIPETVNDRDRFIIQGLYDGRKKEDIARDLGVSPGRVSQLLTVIRSKLKARNLYWLEGVS